MSDRKKSPCLEGVLQLLKNVGLPLSGRIIDVLPNIPCAIGITKDNKVEIAPVPEKASLKALLSGTTAFDWQHAIVAWTGQVFPTESDAFEQLLKRVNKLPESEDITEQLARSTLHDAKPPNYSNEFATVSPSDVDLEIASNIKEDLAVILKAQFKEEVIPVWLADVTEAGTTHVLAQKDSAYRYTTSAMLYRTLHDCRLNDLDESLQESYFAHYRELNLKVALAVIGTYQPGDIIWIHTHQQMLLPEILRRKLPSALIVYSQNEIWASKKTLARFYNHHLMTTALLCANVVLVPTKECYIELKAYYEEQRALTLNYMTSWYPGFSPQFDILPVGLNLPELRASLQAKEVLHQVQTLRNVYMNKKTILTRARIDQLRGMLVVLGAFRHLLRTSPEWIGKVFLFVIITPNRLPGYTFLDGELTVLELFKQILDTNSRFGSASYVPVIYLGGNGGYRPREEYLALLRVADVCIAVNNQESANDMSREFVVAQEKNSSPLLVATYSRVPSSKAFPTVKPGRILYGETMLKKVTDADGQATSGALLHDALTMSEVERRTRQETLFKHLTKQPAEESAALIIQSAGVRGIFQPSRALPMENLLAAYQAAKNRLLIFDYDGTLTPIVNNPNDAIPTASLLLGLQTLCRVRKNMVYIVSGRSREFLQKSFGSVSGLGMSAEHGCYLRKAQDLTGEWTNYTEDKDMSWKEQVESIFAGLEEVYPGSWIERKEVAMVWHYRNAANQDKCLEQATEIKTTLEREEFQHLNLAVMLGKANLEARPREISKGTVVKQLLDEKVFADAKYGTTFAFCAGDDTTDEDMFRAILSSASVPVHYFTCFVGEESRPTMAQYRVDGPQDVVNAILAMANIRT